MAVITVKCQGVNWQADFTPLIDRMYRYFFRCFQRRKDQGELAHRAVCRFMAAFARKWEAGKTIKMATSFTVWHVLAGRDIIGKDHGHQRSVDARLTPPEVARHWKSREPVVDRAAWREMMTMLSKTERGIISLYVARYTYREIKQRLGVHERDILTAIHHASEILNR